MGLINGNEDDALFNPYIENYNYNHADNQFVSSTDEESDSQSVHNVPRTTRHRHRTARQNISVSQENLANRGRKTGVRRARRVDNLRYLLQMEEKDEDAMVLDSSSNFEPCTTLFETLHDDPDKMQMWYSFIESSEEDQRRILNYRGLHDIREEDEEEEGVEGGRTAEENWILLLDDRSDNPAFSPEQCYKRVDRNLRNLLKRRQLPMGLLANLERELVTFFHDCPGSVYVSNLTSSFERMLLHALSQYLNLSSHSFDEQGNRRTQVENKFSDFRPPTLLLTEYLQQHQHNL